MCFIAAIGEDGLTIRLCLYLCFCETFADFNGLYSSIPEVLRRSVVEPFL